MPQPLILFSSVSKAFSGRPVLRGLNWSLEAGQSAVILGPSGSGKSVFLSLLLGFDAPDSGHVDYSNGLQSDLFRHVAVLFQEDALLDDRTVEINLAIARLERADLFSGPLEEEANRAIDAALRDVGLDPFRVRRLLPSALSGGMRRRVALARALIRAPELLIADEPTSGLDPETAASIYELMAELIDRKGMSAAIITHDPLCAARLGCPIYYFTPLEGRLERYEASAVEGSPIPAPGFYSRPSASEISDWLGAMKPTCPASLSDDSSHAIPSGYAALPIIANSRAALLNALDALGRAVLLFRTLSTPPSPRLLAHNLRQWGIGSLGLVALIFALLGIVLLIQAERAISDVGMSNRLPELLALGLSRLAPILTGFLVAGRCGSAVTAQVGWMRLAHQDKALRTMRIEPDASFFPPLFWSWIVVVPLLAGAGMTAGWAAAGAVLGSGISAARITPRFFVNELLAQLDQLTLLSVLLKTVLIAAGMAAIAYGGGVSPKRSATQVASAITRGLVLCFIWLSVVDTTISLLIPG